MDGTIDGWSKLFLFEFLGFFFFRWDQVALGPDALSTHESFA
jgi:hypothetical protein